MSERVNIDEDNFARRVNFARVTVLHRESFLHESKKKQKKGVIKKYRKKTKR